MEVRASSEGLASATVAKRAEDSGGTARDEALADARLLEFAAGWRPALNLHGADEANDRARCVDETPNLKDAPLVPLAAQGAALNPLDLERAWFDGRGRLMCLARGAG